MARRVLDLAGGPLSEAALGAAREAVLDQVGVQLASSTLDWNQVLYRSVRLTSADAPRQARVVNFGDHMPYIQSAFVNGVFGHGCEWDDVVPAADHPGSAIIPTVLALGEVLHSSGDEVVRAVVAGYEAMAKVGRTVRPSILHRGFHPHGVLGPVASCAAAGVLAGLNELELARAFGIAVNQSCGLMEYGLSGGEAKRLLGGYAVRAGLEAVMLAQQGFPAPGNIFEGSRGFCRAYSDDPKPHMIRDDVADVEYVRTAAHKLYPCAWPVHGSIDAAEHLLREYGFAAAEVRHIRIGISDSSMLSGWASIYEPEDVCGAQFSIPFSVALRIVAQRNDLGAYMDPEMRSNSAIRQVARVVTCHADERAVGDDRFLADMEIELHDGSVLRRLQPHPRGSHVFPLTREEMVRKFRTASGLALGAGQVDDLLDACNEISKLDDVGELMSLMVAQR